MIEATLVGRTDAARALGCSISTFIRRYEPQLKPVVDGRGWRLFAVDQLEQIKTTTVVTRMRSARGSDEGDQPNQIDRETYRQVLEAFDKGESVIDVAKRLSLYVEEVEPAFEKWTKYRKGFFLTHQHLWKMWGHINECFDTSVSDRENPEALLKLIDRLADQASRNAFDHSCTYCRDSKTGGHRPALYCVFCAQTRFQSRKR